VTPDLSVEVGKVRLKNPVLTASGTFGYGLEFQPFLELSELGGLVTKGLSPKPRRGNPPERIVETPAGMLNAIGLQNVGVDAFLRDKLPKLRAFDTAVVANVFGETENEYVEVCRKLDGATGVAAIELNVSCPNVRTGLDIGSDPEQLERVMAAVRPATSKPLIVKLTPNCADVAACAVGAQAGGADAVSLINTLRAYAPAPSGANGGSPGPWLGGGTGGLSGPAIRPVALAQVAAVARRVAIPIVGMGGIQSTAHARQFFDAGATLVAVGTESFRDPLAAGAIAAELAGGSDIGGHEHRPAVPFE